MGKNNANPIEQHRAAEKRKLALKNREDRLKSRTQTYLQTDPQKLLRDIKRIQLQERQGIADGPTIARKKHMLEAHFKIMERQKLVKLRERNTQPVVIKGLNRLLGRPSNNKCIEAAPGPELDEDEDTTRARRRAERAEASQERRDSSPLSHESSQEDEEKSPDSTLNEAQKIALSSIQEQVQNIASIPPPPNLAKRVVVSSTSSSLTNQSGLPPTDPRLVTRCTDGPSVPSTFARPPTLPRPSTRPQPSPLQTPTGGVGNTGPPIPPSRHPMAPPRRPGPPPVRPSAPIPPPKRIMSTPLASANESLPKMSMMPTNLMLRKRRPAAAKPAVPKKRKTVSLAPVVPSGMQGDGALTGEREQVVSGQKSSLAAYEKFMAQLDG